MPSTHGPGLDPLNCIKNTYSPLTDYAEAGEFKIIRSNIKVFQGQSGLHETLPQKGRKEGRQRERKKGRRKGWVGVGGREMSPQLRTQKLGSDRASL